MLSVRTILQSVRSGKVSVIEAEKLLKINAIKIVGEIARLDINRSQRRGVPEIIFAANKTNDQLYDIVSSLVLEQINHKLSQPLIISRINKFQFSSLRRRISEILPTERTRSIVLRFHKNANLATIETHRSTYSPGQMSEPGRVSLLCAGTSDVGAMNETEIVLKLAGCRTIRFNDVGIAGLHRLKTPLQRIQKFDPDVIVVAAGMEGALPSIVAGLSGVPVIGVPISSGYGYGGSGEAALMSMLQACPLGITVVNIDGGVAAGVVASLIANRCARRREV